MKPSNWRVVSSVLIILTLLVACGPAKPPHYGAFLTNGNDYVEIKTIRAIFGQPNSSDLDDIPATSDSRPVITLWQQNTIAEYLTMVANAGSGESVRFDVSPKEDGMLEIRPTGSLDAGIYCLVQGDPLGVELLTWCIEIE